MRGVPPFFFQDKTKLTSYVVAAGLLYGAGESLFHFLFKVSYYIRRLLVHYCMMSSLWCVCVAPFQSAWHGDTPALPVFGDGTNILPTIHIHDLAR